MYRRAAAQLGEDIMKKILIVLAVMAFPQTWTLSTVCSAGVSCYVKSDGSCASEGAMCGPISKGKHCTTTGLSAKATTSGARKTPPQGLGCVCQ